MEVRNAFWGHERMNAGPRNSNINLPFFQWTMIPLSYPQAGRSHGICEAIRDR
jgi:hypothetical protein